MHNIIRPMLLLLPHPSKRLLIRLLVNKVFSKKHRLDSPVKPENDNAPTSIDSIETQNKGLCQVKNEREIAALLSQ